MDESNESLKKFITRLFKGQSYGSKAYAKIAWRIDNDLRDICKDSRVAQVYSNSVFVFNMKGVIAQNKQLNLLC